MLESKNNAEYEILTPNGWSSFTHIKRNKQNNLIKIIFEDQSEIICTQEHLFKKNNEFVCANKVDTGDVLTGKKVWSVLPVQTNMYVYDAVNVEKNNEYYTNNVVSHNCTFLGSAGTLISAAALKNMVFTRSIRQLMDGLEIYADPEPGHFYVMSVDSSRGQGLDYSAFVIFDTSAQPFKIVGKYRNNTISPMLFPNVIVQTAKHYNEAYLLIENNDVGAQIADLTFSELEYDNMFHGEESNGRFNMSQGRAKQLGIKTTKRVKRQGCNALKELIENGKLAVQDFNVIEELSTFILAKDGTYRAEEGAHDDLAMCCVLFSWLTSQAYFKDLTNFDIRQRLYDEKMRQMEDELPPMPMVQSDNIENPKYFMSHGMIWESVDDNDGASYSDTYKHWNNS